MKENYRKIGELLDHDEIAIIVKANIDDKPNKNFYQDIRVIGHDEKLKDMMFTAFLKGLKSLIPPKEINLMYR
jgi:hypothetical protein